MSIYGLSAAAKQDLREIKNYMARLSLGAATRFLDVFEEKSRLLAAFPACPIADVGIYYLLHTTPETVKLPIALGKCGQGDYVLEYKCNN